MSPIITSVFYRHGLSATKERRVFCKQQHSNFGEQDHLGVFAAAENKVLAQEEKMSFAKGHFKEVRGGGGGGGRRKEGGRKEGRKEGREGGI